MRYLCLACDFDGTLASEGRVSAGTLAALERLKSSGRKVILVTGRELDELLRVFPEYALCEKIVAENGAVLYSPATRDIKLLADPIPSEFVLALRKAHVDPLSIGRVIVATDEPHDATVLASIRQLGFDLQVIYNKGSVMVLPSGINKGTGLLAALSDLGLSEHNAVGVGDAENDHALLALCECGVAVGNAIPSLRERADIVTTESAGQGVEQLVDMILLNDLQNVESRTEHLVVLGHSSDGRESAIKTNGNSLVIAGPSASGKSTVVRAILERLIEHDYQVCVIDPEGDYEHHDKIVSLGTADRAPDQAEVLQILEKPKASVSVNLLGLRLPDRPPFFAALLAKIHELRVRTGRPHWIIADEAHHLLPSDWDPAIGAMPEKLSGVILVTVHVDSVLPAALKSMSGIIAVGPTPEQTIRQFTSAIGVAPPVYGPLPSKTGEVFLWYVGEAPRLVSVRVLPAADETRRHKRKYAEGQLGPDRSFFFRGAEGKFNLRAYNLTTFVQMAEGIDDETWLYHLRQGDYSKWMRKDIKDDDLASEVMETEKDLKVPAKESRTSVIEAIRKRYTASE